MTKRLPSYPPVDGQLDVFDVLELVEKEGLVPDNLPDPCPPPPEDCGISQSTMLEGVETELRVTRGIEWSFWVVDPEGNKMHERPFWSQIECWAFIVGWERSRHRP